jgi:hypothetical protein
VLVLFGWLLWLMAVVMTYAFHVDGLTCAVFDRGWFVFRGRK